jgi:hypothetical protein
MTTLWTIVTFAFTFGTLGVVAYAIVRSLTRHSNEDHAEPPTVDAGWRASWPAS